jgi:hypothetical protein
LIERLAERSIPVDIADLLTREHVVAALPANDKPALLHDLSQRAARALTIDRQVILDALLAREALGSTGVGGGGRCHMHVFPACRDLLGFSLHWKSRSASKQSIARRSTWYFSS